jgi:RNA polymerase sigma-70 factor (ECF subfamily)
METGATPAETDEAALAQAFANRERWAFDEAYRRYGSLLYSVALTVLHRPEDAEDCVHDALVHVWNNPRAYAANRGSVRAFLVVCVRNNAISRVRMAGRRRRLSERFDLESEATEEFEIHDFVESQRIRDALAQLPEDQRTAVMLAFFGGKTHVEISEQLHEPLGTIKSRISHGLRKLAAALGTR